MSSSPSSSNSVSSYALQVSVEKMNKAKEEYFYYSKLEGPHKMDWLLQSLFDHYTDCFIDHRRIREQVEANHHSSSPSSPSSSSPVSLPPPCFKQWKSVGILATCVDISNPIWQYDGQFVVIHPDLIMSCTHSCFYSQQTSKAEVKKGEESESTEPQPRIPCQGFMGIFYEPLHDDIQYPHIVTSTRRYQIPYDLISCSGSIDGAVLRRKFASLPLPFTPVALRIVPDILLESSLIVSIVAVIKEDRVMDPEYYIIEQQLSTIMRVCYPHKLHGSRRVYTLAYSAYKAQKGFSGAPVVIWTGKEFQLAGIHTRTDSTGWNGNSRFFGAESLLRHPHWHILAQLTAPVYSFLSITSLPSTSSSSSSSSLPSSSSSATSTSLSTHSSMDVDNDNDYSPGRSPQANQMQNSASHQIVGGSSESNLSVISESEEEPM